jgi:hypothetical protein
MNTLIKLRILYDVAIINKCVNNIILKYEVKILFLKDTNRSLLLSANVKNEKGKYKILPFSECL